MENKAMSDRFGIGASFKREISRQMTHSLFIHLLISRQKYT